jgi:hypothetical protein
MAAVPEAGLLRRLDPGGAVAVGVLAVLLAGLAALALGRGRGRRGRALAR